MKITSLIAPAMAISAMTLASVSRSEAGTTSPAVPVGWLTASPGYVKVGANPVLTWNITYPSTVEDYVKINTPATVVPNQTLDMQVRVLGAGVTTSSSTGSNLTFVPTEACISVNNSSYQRIFYGTNLNVDPNKVVYSATVQANQSIRFGGRYYYNRSWSEFYHSTYGTNNVRTLVNGQTPPTTYPLHTAPTLESFLKPFLDASGKVVIGPMDVIVFMELTHTDSQVKNQGYDLQDMVLLVTYKPKN
jgi:hypothetical protein